MLSFQDSIVPVVIADDHELTRFAIKLGLSSQSNIKIVGLASNGNEAIEMVNLHHPHVIILDLQMPVLDGLSASVYIKAFDPNIKIIAYTSV
ncbi:MAG TPA: response regulator transcription factor, partial [Allocoleopsis sp.]